jgi:hypothetical protein
VTEPTEGKASDQDPSSTSTTGQFGSRLAGGGQGNAGGWPSGGGGFPGRRSDLRLSGNEPSFSGPVLVLDPGDQVAPHPTPEPRTIALVGLNVLVLSVMAWKRRPDKEEHTPGG